MRARHAQGFHVKTSYSTDAVHAEQLVERAKPIFAGQPFEIIGAALADLVAIWLASHVYRDMPGTTDAMREGLLADLVDTVRKLVPVNAAILGTDAET